MALPSTIDLISVTEVIDRQLNCMAVENHLANSNVVKSEFASSTSHSVKHSIDYLDSAQAATSVKRDPYWPKWDSPWWHMTLLYEIGLANKIPAAACKNMVASLNLNYLKVFPFRLEDVPAGFDPYRHIACHCALGTMYQVLSAAGIDVDSELPWIRPWFLKYQLPDGGLNCDESAYTKEIQRSSVLSTLPPLEAILFFTNRPFTKEETIFLDRGAQYLIERQLFRSLSKNGQIIDEQWLNFCFPRFYDYDILRGLNFLVHWSEKRKLPLPLAAIAETIELTDKQFPQGKLAVVRQTCAGDNTWVQDASGTWSKTSTLSKFSLFQATSIIGLESPFLQHQWLEALTCLKRILNKR